MPLIVERHHPILCTCGLHGSVQHQVYDALQVQARCCQFADDFGGGGQLFDPLGQSLIGLLVETGVLDGHGGLTSNALDELRLLSSEFVLLMPPDCPYPAGNLAFHQHGHQ